MRRFTTHAEDKAKATEVKLKAASASTYVRELYCDKVFEAVVVMELVVVVVVEVVEVVVMVAAPHLSCLSIRVMFLKSSPASPNGAVNHLLL